MSLSDKKGILVDFFDTIMFRRVSAKAAVRQWAVCLQSKYEAIATLEISRIVEMRKHFLSQRGGLKDPCFSDAMALFYDQCPELKKETDRDSFIHVAGQLDKAVEYGCQYPNYKLLKKLRKYKNQNKKIVIVSDFYWGKEAICSFLSNANIDIDLFDEIFVSSDCKMSKAAGTLFSHVLEKMDLTPENVLMIGDHPKSDYRNAKAAGLDADLQRHLFRKGVNYIRRKTGYDFSHVQMKRIAKSCYRHGLPFSEYILEFYRFTRDLHAALGSDGVSKAAFMAREGYYLQLLFERYQILCAPVKSQIQPMYLKCSRRSVFSGVDEDHRKEMLNEPISIRNWLKSLYLTVDDLRRYIDITDEEADEVTLLAESEKYQALLKNESFMALYRDIVSQNHDAFLTYIKNYIDNNWLNVVDSGWLGTTQLALKKYYDISSTGYYLGIQQLADCPEGVIRHGLLFEEPDSKYYHYIGMNFPFYQELLAAPHGSAIKYLKNEDGSVDVLEEWDETEKKLYEESVMSLQTQMTTLFDGLCAWNLTPQKKEEWIAAKTIFHSNMFAYGDRYQFIRKCENSFFVNFQQEKKGAKNYDYKEVKLGLNVFTSPEKYIRYFTKIQRSALYNKKIVRALYPAVARCYYWYVLAVGWLKGVPHK